jgi:hypothetical protein
MIRERSRPGLEREHGLTRPDVPEDSWIAAVENDLFLLQRWRGPHTRLMEKPRRKDEHLRNLKSRQIKLSSKSMICFSG